MRMGRRTGVGTAILGLLLSATIAVADDSIIVGTDGNDTITGTAVADSIYARAGDDQVNAGAGDDELDGGPGKDDLSGGDGEDAVLYSGSTPVDASLDATRNDGAAGENDFIKDDVEDLYGGDGNDKLTGNARANTLDGGAGDDRISGGGGTDVLAGGDGDDVIDARDGAVDRVECGPGNDTASVDITDVVVDCEQVAKPGLTQTPLVGILRGNLALGSVANGSRIVVYCVTGCGPANSKILELASVKKNKKGLVTAKLSPKLRSKLRSSVIEVGVTAPESTTACRQYKISASFRLSNVSSGGQCTTPAKGA